jgi:hypothetical protein
VSVVRFGPCTFDKKLFSDFTVRIGATDVSESLFFSLTALINEFPTEPLLLPVFGYPAPGPLPAVTPESPLVLGFTVTALDPNRSLSAAQLMLRNPFDIPLTGTVTTDLMFPNGTSTTFGVGTSSPTAQVSFAPSASMAVRISLTGMAERESAGVGFWAVSAAAPVPEPATLSLIGVGLAVAARAMRRGRQR